MSIKRQSWSGTIPLFILIVSIFLAVFLCSAYLGLIIFQELENDIIILILAFLTGLVGFGLFLNIPIARRSNPEAHFNSSDEIARGAWTTVYKHKTEPNKVIKQIYPCGWGHNDYTKHQAFVIGKKKICGKWNPLVLWFLHNYMVLYQLIGLKRRKRFEGSIEALPRTYDIHFKKLFYEQEWVHHPLNEQTCPSDIIEQFETLNKELEKCGLYIDDVHLGNVRVDENGRIKIIDGELYSGGEEWVKSKVVVIFNGAKVSSMKKVLGNDRIIAWVDHRKGVDDLLKEISFLN